MGLPFINSRAKKRDQVLAIDLGGHTTKAVHVQRRGEKLSLLGYAILPTPVHEKTFSTDVLADHLKAVTRALGGRTKQITLAVGVNDALFRQVELPLMPVDDMRQMLKFNSKNYLQQDLPDHVFDCGYVVSASSVNSGEAAKPAANQKHKVMVGGAKRQFIDDVQTAIKTAGLVPDQVVPGVIGPTNAFEMAEPEVFAKEVVALVEIGFKNTVITILDCGEIKLNRVVGIGGDRLTAGLAETMSISYAEAESIKIGMPGEVQQNLEPLIHPLGRELRASIDFFENQQDRTVSQVLLSGGSARSEFIIQTLQTELMVPCKIWAPTKSLQLELGPEKMGEVEQTAPQLTVAIGAATAAF